MLGPCSRREWQIFQEGRELRDRFILLTRSSNWTCVRVGQKRTMISEFHDSARLWS